MDAFFKNYVKHCVKNDPKVNRVPSVPVQMEENGDHHRISHGLKPLGM